MVGILDEDAQKEMEMELFESSSDGSENPENAEVSDRSEIWEIINRPLKPEKKQRDYGSK